MWRSTLLLSLVAFTTGCGDPLISTGRDIDGTWELTYLEVPDVAVYCPVNCSGNTWDHLPNVMVRLVLNLGGSRWDGDGEAVLSNAGNSSTVQLSWRYADENPGNALYLRFEGGTTETRFEAQICCAVGLEHALTLTGADWILKYERVVLSGL